MKQVRDKYDRKKLARRLMANKDFMLTRFRQEWDNIQKTAKREKLIATSKEKASIVAATILKLLAIGGIASVALIAPNVFVVYDRAGKRKAYFEKKNFIAAKNYLSKYQYARIDNVDFHNMKIVAKENGFEHIFVRCFKALTIKKISPWDGFWRIIIFDIPNKHKWAREGFRKELKRMGFYQLQESVFIIPYPCEEEIKFFVAVFNISAYARFIQTKELFYSDDVEKIFNVR